jgi:predicted DNA-binding transcriptional regulator AlpA
MHENMKKGKKMEIYIEGDTYLDSEEVAKKLGIAEITLQVRTRAKEIPLPIKLKSRIWWKKSQIDEYLEKTRGGTN